MLHLKKKRSYLISYFFHIVRNFNDHYRSTSVQQVRTVSAVPNFSFSLHVGRRQSTKLFGMKALFVRAPVCVCVCVCVLCV